MIYSRKIIPCVVLVGSMVACASREGTNFNATKADEVDDCAKFCNKATAAGCSPADCPESCRSTIADDLGCRDLVVKSWACAANEGTVSCSPTGGFLVGGCAAEQAPATACLASKSDVAVCKEKQTYLECTLCCGDSLPDASSRHITYVQQCICKPDACLDVCRSELCVTGGGKDSPACDACLDETYPACAKSVTERCDDDPDCKPMTQCLADQCGGKTNG